MKITHRSILWTFFGVLHLTSCVNLDVVRQEAYDEGHVDGHSEGLKQGHSKGLAEGIEQGRQQGMAAKYDEIVDAAVGKQTLTLNPSANFVPQINSQSLIQKLDENQQHFDEALKEVHVEVLKGLGTSLGLPSTQQNELITVYDRHHALITKGYFDQYQTRYLTQSSSKDQDTYFSYQRYDRAEAFADVVGQQLCSAVELVLGLFKMETGASIATGLLAGDPCAFLAGKLLTPITNQLLETGFIQDIHHSRLKIEKQVSQVIVELATVQKGYDFTLYDTNDVKVYDVKISTAIIEAHYKGIVKAGFDLNERFALKIDEASRKIHLQLPAAKLFLPIVYPRIDEIENGWIAKIDHKTINEMQIRAIRMVEQMALEDHILEEAETNAYSFLKMLFGQVAKVPPTPYRVEIASR